MFKSAHYQALELLRSPDADLYLQGAQLARFRDWLYLIAQLRVRRGPLAARRRASDLSLVRPQKRRSVRAPTRHRPHRFVASRKRRRRCRDACNWNWVFGAPR